MTSKIKDSNYVTIQGWMINQLHLSGNELIAYAVIYGFSQAENQYMTCSQEYIGNWCNLSRVNTNKLLKRLIDKGYIIKKLRDKKGAIATYEYKAIAYNETLHVTSNETLHATSNETLHVTSNETLHNNKKIIKKDIYKQKRNKFNDFEQRNYTPEDFKNMEKRLLNKK